MAIWSILLPFGTYILWSFWHIFPPFWNVESRKIWQTCFVALFLLLARLYIETMAKKVNGKMYVEFDFNFFLKKSNETVSKHAAGRGDIELIQQISGCFLSLVNIDEGVCLKKNPSTASLESVEQLLMRAKS
jgi:hypothetical protein